MAGTHTRGMTVVDSRAESDDGGHLVLRTVDAAAVVEQVIAAVEAQTGAAP